MLLSGPAFALDPLGQAVDVDPAATANLNGATTTVLTGADLYEGQVITTGPSGQVQILFSDNTRMVVGPNSSLVLETYLLRNDGSVGSFAVEALGGTFRFITGDSDKQAYQINTPTGTIGVRGTAFDLYVDWSTGEGFVWLLEGAVKMCASVGQCVELIEKCGLGTIPVRSEAYVFDRDTVDVYTLNFPYERSQASLKSHWRVRGSLICGLSHRSGGANPPQPHTVYTRNSTSDDDGGNGGGGNGGGGGGNGGGGNGGGGNGGGGNGGGGGDDDCSHDGDHHDGDHHGDCGHDEGDHHDGDHHDGDHHDGDHHEDGDHHDDGDHHGDCGPGDESPSYRGGGCGDHGEENDNDNHHGDCGPGDEGPSYRGGGCGDHGDQNSDDNHNGGCNFADARPAFRTGGCGDNQNNEGGFHNNHSDDEDNSGSSHHGDENSHDNHQDDGNNSHNNHHDDNESSDDEGPDENAFTNDETPPVPVIVPQSEDEEPGNGGHSNHSSNGNSHNSHNDDDGEGSDSNHSDESGNNNHNQGSSHGPGGKNG
ncbi:MAG: FecR domain-containing protein [Hyphomicrobiaceae bacterium]|nr:FecR domain-containing protein [Hyphomicrobiaceae bacterium]